MNFSKKTSPLNLHSYNQAGSLISHTCKIYWVKPEFFACGIHVN